MNDTTLKSLDRDAIKSILRMGGGYVLAFSDRTFSEFFANFGIQIDEDPYLAFGTSKANRLRAFLRTAPPKVVGDVLAALLERRLAKAPEEIDPQELERYRTVVTNLGGTLPVMVGAAKVAELDREADLLRRVFQPEQFNKLPLDGAMSEALISRMEEAHRCIDGNAYLAAVILCGSVLEGMCLGFGSRQPERVNRAFAAQYNRTPPQFHDWKLREWIEVLGRLGDLSPNVEKFGQALRDFRNYVHPAEQLANRFSPDHHTARISFQVVVAAVEDLVRAAASKTAVGAP